jgi:RNA polymerase sigma factor (TIGR02999 family)
MAETHGDDVTRYLAEMQRGDGSAADRLLPLLYQDLHRIAERFLQDQRRDHTLQPTALVHEAYMRLVKPGAEGWESRRHFMSVAALAMRQLLTDYARRRDAQKRRGGHVHVAVGELGESALPAPEENGCDLVALSEALEELRAMDERQARIVELRFLTGLTVEETAAVLGVSERTVFLDWKMARSWLERRLGED